MYENISDALIVEDNDRKHKSKEVKSIIERENINVMDGYPANSPHLNSMENICEIWDR